MHQSTKDLPTREDLVIGSKWTHIKDPNTVYIIITFSTLQINDSEHDKRELVVYTKDSLAFWARPVDEFLDGRFIKADNSDKDMEMMIVYTNPPDGTSVSFIVNHTKLSIHDFGGEDRWVQVMAFGRQLSESLKAQSPENLVIEESATMLGRQLGKTARYRDIMKEATDLINKAIINKIPKSVTAEQTDSLRRNILGKRKSRY